MVAEGVLRYGDRLIRDQETFDLLMDLQVSLSAKGATDREIAGAVNAMLDEQQRRLH
jgi:hypothetical protein